MAEEDGALEEIFATMKLKYDTFIVGGAKPNEHLDVVSHIMSEGTVEKVLTGGIVGQLFLMARGYDLGAPEEFIKKKKWMEFLPQAKELISKHGDKIETLDLAIDFGVSLQCIEVTHHRQVREIISISVVGDYYYKVIFPRVHKVYLISSFLYPLRDEMINERRERD